MIIKDRVQQEPRKVHINDCNNVFEQIINVINARLPHERLEITIDCPIIIPKGQMIIGVERDTVIINGEIKVQ